MAHPRKEIRDKIKAILEAGATLAGTRVFTSRVIPFFELELPAIAIHTPSEQSERQDNYGLKRILMLVIECIAEKETDVEDDLDQMASEVEALMRVNWAGSIGISPRFGFELEDVFLTGTDMNFQDDGRKEIASIILTYHFRYQSCEPELTDQTFDDLLGIDVEYEQPPADAEIDAEDTIDLPQ